MIMGASTGCFIYETLLLLALYPNLGGVEMFVHHLASLASTVSGGLAQKCHYFIMLLLVTEITNPFISLRWYLDRSGYRNSKAYIANGLMMFLCWIPFRLLIFMPFYYNFRRYFSNIIGDLGVIYIILMFLVPPLLLSLNIFWFGKIARGIVRVVIKGMEAERASRVDNRLFGERAASRPEVAA